jgi:hypothetical protein
LTRHARPAGLRMTRPNNLRYSRSHTGRSRRQSRGFAPLVVSSLTQQFKGWFLRGSPISQQQPRVAPARLKSSTRCLLCSPEFHLNGRNRISRRHTRPRGRGARGACSVPACRACSRYP